MFTQRMRAWAQAGVHAMRVHGGRSLAALTALATVAALVLVVAPAHAEDSRVADPTTFTQWEQGIGDPTDPRSTGRVWTDKSVSTGPVTLETYDHKEVTVTPQDDAFLVGLSAMSSAQKLIGVSNVTKPLDIVLVLDTSGSMRYGMDGDDEYAYDPVYADSITTSGRYYVRVDGSMTRVRHSSANGWYYNAGGTHYVTPKTSVDDSDASHTQFYSRRSLTIEDTRMYALKQAVNGFIDQTIESNAKVGDPNKKNRIGLVTYASSANRRSGLTDSLDGLKTTVDGLSASGATRADLGLQEANTVLGNARDDAAKIVIFFTDGEPTSGSSFEDTVANTAIANAKKMKDDGASVYSVGIFNGADPAADVSNVSGGSNTTLKSNAFMQGVSSNYPNATAYTDLGTRTPNSNYYLAASDADALNAVFETIWGEVSSNPESPIQSETTSGTTGGNGVVTFTDQLGDYMHVTRMNSIVFAGKQYTAVSPQTSADGSQTIYTFEGTVEANEIYKAADLSTMRIVVTHTAGKTGDLVTVNVPAELLPLRLYTATVDRDGNVTTSINRTNPMRLFYEVNLKDGVLAKVADPDEQMRQYLADSANIDADGNVRFLTNAYSKAANGANGSTTAVFTPATTNDFYYFTQDTPLYNSPNTGDPATSIEAGKTYYYQRTYYANNAKHEQWIDVLGENAVGKAQQDDDGHYYAPAGLVRTGLSRLYTAEKESDPTGTAANSIAPHWEMNNVTVNLGNNGLRKVARPGALEVTETVEWTDGEMPQAVKSKAFPFSLSLSGVGADGEYQAVIAGQSVTVKNGAQFSLKHGESVMVYGLPAGTKATVTQTDAGGKGWSVNHEVDEGAIAAGETTRLGFANRYQPDPVTLPEGSIKGSKTLVNRDWQPDEAFTFQIAAGDANPDAPMPDPATVTVRNPNVGEYKDGQKIDFEFGAIEYTAAGTYQYVITEQGGGKPGMAYSGARYIATVTVTDNMDGTMGASVVLTNTLNDNGDRVVGEPQVGSADFKNAFIGENTAMATIRGIKHYTDYTGSNKNTFGKFNVEITADEGNPADGPTFEGTVPVGIDGTWARELQFTNDALNGKDSETFTYHVREIVPEGVDAQRPTLNGMTYDVNTYDVQVTVSRDAQQNLITTVTYPDGKDRVELTNSYRAADTDAQPLQVTKTVTGRDVEDGKFTFGATLRTDNAKYVKVKQQDGTLKDWADVSVPAPAIKKGASAGIDFGSLVFTMPGTYTFAVREQLPDGANAANPKVDGWSYDTHEYTVTYTVTDDNGKLKATSATKGEPDFTNAYTASVDYGTDGTMRIGKTLTGRSMNPQEFSFAITPIDGAPMPNGAQSVTTANPFSAVSGQELVWPVPGTLLADLTFTQDDAGRTYRYTIREVPPEGVSEDNPKKNGVTYDLRDHTVSITVIDNGNGTLKTETKVDGQADGVARFANTYTIAKGESAVGFAKAITGRDWKDGESFTFELTPNTGQSSVSESVLKAAMPKGASVTVGKPDIGRTAAFAFNGFTFDQTGTYVYNVREQGAGESKDGLTHDARTALVSFTVTDKGDGTYSIGRLITGIGFENGLNTFTNAYKAKEFTGVPTGMAFSKELAGIEWTKDRVFEFTLEAVIEGAPMPADAKVSVGKPAGGDIADFAFGEITYTEAGVYKYVVKEAQGDMPGVSYDGHSAKVTVTVSDNGRGQLVAEATVDGAKFTNTYTAQPFDGVPAGMEFSKQLTGIDWPAGRVFDFTLEGKDGAPMPAETKVSVGKPADDDTAAFGFGAIRYEKPGTYEYMVKEMKGDMPGVSYDNHVAKVTVTVTDNGQGQLEAVAVVTEGAFVNTYGAQPSGGVPEGMTFIKQLTGVDWPADRMFEFTLEGADGAPMPEGAQDGKLNATVSKPADGSTAVFDFGAIKYTAEGEYKYTVTESAGDMPGVAYAKNTATVLVTVTDDKQGNLIAKAEVTGGVFTNVYTAQPVTVPSADLKLSKQLTGIDWPADRAFEFTLEAVTQNAPMPANAKVAVGKPDKGDTADFGFGEITYAEAGVYEYTVKEAKGDMPGVSYDGHMAKVTVTVADNGQGQLEATVKTDGGEFVNAYSAKEFTGVPAGMAFSKQLTGIDWPDNGVFTFTLTGKGDAPMPEKTTVSVGKPADGGKADFAFGDITYTKTGTYTYTVKELAGIMPGVAFDDHEATVTVTVTDNGKGQLEAKAVVDKADFVNTYTTKEFTGVPTGMAFSKELNGTEWAEGRAFTFMIEAVDGAPAPEQPTVTVGKPGNGNTADFTFGALTFTKTGTYRYVVTERNDGQPGITYDDHKAYVTVTVTDNGLGHLVATAKVDDAKFTNTYTAQSFEGVPAGMAFSKQLTGIAWPADRTFEFTLEGKDGAPMPAETKATVGKPAKGDAASFDFGAIHYEKAGVYEYTVKETKGDMPGVSYDGHSAAVTVTVRDNGQGQLEATAVVTDAAFVNTYGTTPSDGVPEGMAFIKQLDGIEWPADRTFEFTLEGVDGAPMPAKGTLQVAKPADGNAAVFDFGAITYTAEGEYRYKVRETKGDMPGVSYDTHVADVTVTVTDNKQGDLVATATVVGNVFVNEYTAKEFTGVPAGLAFSKELTGIDWPAGRTFEFTIEGKDESMPMPAKTKATVGKPAEGAKADFAFGDITYTQPGVYEYTVKEAKGDMPGVSYDTHVAKVTVKVSDNGQGQLEAKATVEGAKFTNSYHAKPFDGVPGGLELSKQLTGIDWPADRTFEFTLEGKDGAPMPAEAKVSVGKPEQGDTAGFGFGAIRYEKPGVYEYTVKETRGTMPGVAYDHHAARIAVTVADNGQGQLEAAAKVTEGAFVNTYTAVPATGVPTDFTLTKRVEGMEWNADQKFEFAIQGQDGAPMPKDATVTVGRPANGDSANFDFGEIVFDRAGVYRYTVTETAGSQPGMVYDGHTATVTVDVADDGQGHLVTATTVVNGLFTNTYSTQAVAYPGVDVTEDLTGRAQTQGEFQFVMSGSAEDMARAGYPAGTVTSPAYEFAAAASGETVTVPGLFTGLELTHADVRAGKRFVYEVDQTGAQSGSGLTVDDQVYRVEIWAADNGDGTMRVHTSINGAESTESTPVLPFHNVYATAPVTIGGDAPVRINAHKTLHGRALAAGEFTFAVRDAKGAQLAGGTNAADGMVNFDAIEFTDARLAADVQSGIATAHVSGTQTVYRYEATVSEVTDALPAGVTPLESGFAVTLVITDNGKGALAAAVEYPADANGTLGFVNQYGAASEISLGLAGNKVLAVASGDNAPDITGKYTFTLSGSEGAPMPAKTTVANDAAGAVDFGPITYTMANVFGEQEATPESKDAEGTETDDVTTREKTFTYTVTESGAVAGVVNDAAPQRTITVRVQDNGDGTLTVSKQSDGTGTDFTFTNTYGVKPTDPTSPTDTSVKGGVPLTKTLKGRDLKSGEFTFELIEAASGKVVGTAANAADGSVSLPGVVFDAPGSYAYLVRESAGTVGGITYDTRVYAAVATVVDNGDGTLGVSWAVTEPAVGLVEAMVFANTYAAQPTSVQISAGKMLLGRDLAAGEFQFALTAVDSAPMPEGTTDGVQTVANDEHGNAQFGVIDYAKAGEYHYTVSEVKGDAEGVTYDETEHAVAVRVTDNGEGQLLAAVEYGEGENGVVFTNTYTKPTEPDTPGTPDTPDQPKPVTPSAPQHPASGTPTYRPYSYSTGTGTVAYTGADVALIVAVAAVLLAAGVALLTVVRRRQ